MASEPIKCPECGTVRNDLSVTCPTCGAPPFRPGEKRAQEEEVRTEDLEPYVTLRYIARLFKVMAVLTVIMLIGEIVTGLLSQGQGALLTLLGETSRWLMTAAFLWGAGDISVLLIDAGHDLRVARILLGRINAELHRRGGSTEPAEREMVTRSRG